MSESEYQRDPEEWGLTGGSASNVCTGVGMKVLGLTRRRERDEVGFSEGGGPGVAVMVRLKRSIGNE